MPWSARRDPGAEAEERGEAALGEPLPPAPAHHARVRGVSSHGNPRVGAPLNRQDGNRLRGRAAPARTGDRVASCAARGGGVVSAVGA